MAGVNKAIIVGYLGRDPEIRYSQQGTAVVNLNVATTEIWYDKSSGEKKDMTQWHRIVIFGKQGENCEKYLAKGSQVYIEGRIQTRDYEKDGQKHYVTDIVANTVQFLGSGGRQNSGAPDSSGGQGYAGNAGNGSPPDNQGYSGPSDPGQTGNMQGSGQEPDDDIPF